MRVFELLPVLSVMAAFLAMIPFAAVHARSGQPVQVQCAAGRSFTVRLGEQQAIVELPDERLTLIRRPSSLGSYYRNEETTLIVDGSYLAFVQKSDLAWRDCRVESEGAVSKP